MGNLAAHLSLLYLIVKEEVRFFCLWFAKLAVQSAKFMAKCRVLSKLLLALKCHLHTLCQNEALGEQQFNLLLIDTQM